MLNVVRAALLSGFIAAVSPALAGPDDDPVFRVFQTFCVFLLNDTERLASGASETGRRLTREQAFGFLAPKDGSAWAIQPDGRTVVVLTLTSEGVCGVHQPYTEGRAVRGRIASEKTFFHLSTRQEGPIEATSGMVVAASRYGGPDFRALVRIEVSTAGDGRGVSVHVVPERVAVQDTPSLTWPKPPQN